MGLTVLSVAFPLTTVRPDSSGGAEQVLAEIDRGLVSRGHKSLVIASEGSRIAGTLLPTKKIKGLICDADWRAADEAIRKAMTRAFDQYKVDLVHLHGHYYSEYLPQNEAPVLVTLHVPLSWYKPGSLQPARPRTCLHGVSRSQMAAAPPGATFLPVIENGVRTDLLRPLARVRKKRLVACLGRICPEKGFHLALQAARKADVGLVLAGQIFPFAEHHQYFNEKIAPELDEMRRYIGAVGLKRKRQLLSTAQCLIVPSVVPETSSLVAREALSCGTPVVAFAQGALPEVVTHGKTGFIVSGPEELPEAIRACASLDPEDCRREAVERFSADRMVDEYLATYRRIAGGAGLTTQVA